MRDEKEPLPAWMTGAILLATALLISGLMFFGVSGLASRPMSAPKSYKKFETPDKSVTGLGPDGWTRTRSAGMGGTEGGVSFSQGSARIQIKADLAGSLMGDMAAAANAQLSNLGDSIGGQAPAQKPPIVKVHEMGQGEVEDAFDTYSELPMQNLQTPLGEGRFSEFTGKTEAGPFGGQGYLALGYRATVLSTEKRVTVVCWCSKKDWATLKPVFEKVINSLKPGSN